MCRLAFRLNDIKEKHISRSFSLPCPIPAFFSFGGQKASPQIDYSITQGQPAGAPRGDPRDLSQRLFQVTFCCFHTREEKAAMISPKENHSPQIAISSHLFRLGGVTLPTQAHNQCPKAVVRAGGLGHKHPCRDSFCTSFLKLTCTWRAAVWFSEFHKMGSSGLCWVLPTLPVPYLCQSGVNCS